MMSFTSLYQHGLTAVQNAPLPNVQSFLMSLYGSMASPGEPSLQEQAHRSSECTEASFTLQAWVSELRHVS